MNSTVAHFVFVTAWCHTTIFDKVGILGPTTGTALAFRFLGEPNTPIVDVDAIKFGFLTVVDPTDQTRGIGLESAN